MSTLARPVFLTPHWRLGLWVARAWQRLGWRHVLAALLIDIGGDPASDLRRIIAEMTEVEGRRLGQGGVDGDRQAQAAA